MLYFTIDIGGNLVEVTQEEIAKGYILLFFQAPSKKILLAMVDKVVNQAGDTPLSTISFGKAEFIAGDNIRFQGQPVGKVEIETLTFLKIEVFKSNREGVFAFFMVTIKGQVSKLKVFYK